MHRGVHRNSRHSYGMRRQLCPNEVHHGSGCQLWRQGHRGRSSASCCVRDRDQNCGCEWRSRYHRPSSRHGYRKMLLGQMNGGSCC